ncbi:unnamed protein product [Ectocarpus sp. 12 AP-2014]
MWGFVKSMRRSLRGCAILCQRYKLVFLPVSLTNITGCALLEGCVGGVLSPVSVRSGVTCGLWEENSALPGLEPACENSKVVIAYTMSGCCYCCCCHNAIYSFSEFAMFGIVTSPCIVNNEPRSAKRDLFSLLIPGRGKKAVYICQRRAARYRGAKT